MPFSFRQTDSSLWIPTVLCGISGFLAAMAVWLLGYLSSIEEWYANKSASLIGMNEVAGVFAVEFLFIGAFVLAVVLALALLDTPGKLRRLLILLSASVLVLGLGPVGLLFGNKVSVIFLLLCVWASGLCALYWAAHHRMPCERMVRPKRIPAKQKEELLKTKRISLKALKAEAESITSENRPKAG